MKTWIRRQAASGKPLNVHAVMRERPDLLAKAYAGAQPRGWRRCLLDAGVDPYRIVHEHTNEVQCRICGEWRVVLGRHLQYTHGTTSREYIDEYGPDCEVSSESFRVARFSNKRVLGIRHWEKLWSRYQVIDWLLLLHEQGHNLNYFHIAQNAKQLASAALCFFHSWDDALKAAGLDPAVVRAVGPTRTWTQKQVLQQLRVFVKAAKTTNATRPPALPNDLRTAALRHFTTLELAAAAAGVEHEAICPRAVYRNGTVEAVVKAIRSLEGLKGRERREKLDKIYHGDATARRIVMNHYNSLRQLALEEGIDPAVVAPEVYRDAADVDHDLDLLEQEYGSLDIQTIYKGHRRLYNVIRETGWGGNRLIAAPRPPLEFPPCNPASGRLRDRMIMMRQKRKITMQHAAKEAGVSTACWGYIEGGRNPSENSTRLIERLLAKHKIPAPRTSKSTQTH